MQYQSLTKAQRLQYLETVSGSHHRAVSLEILTLDGEPRRSLTNRFIGGSIQGDMSSDPVEVLECQILDDDYALDWEGGQYRKFKARVVDARFIPALNDWVEEVAFTGPIWDFERTGAVVSLVAHGSEQLAMGSIRDADTIRAKTKATDAIRRLLRGAGAGPADMRIPALNARLPRDVTVGIKVGKKPKDPKVKQRRVQKLKVGREDTYWGKAASIAEAIDRTLFADNRGRFVLEGPRQRATHTLTERMLLAPVDSRRGADGEVPNTWIILGANPKGPKKRIKAVVALPPQHPLSAQTLKWGGELRRVYETTENNQLRTKKQADRVGARKRDRVVRELVTYEVQVLLVVPYVRPGSLASIPTGGGRATARWSSWTLPLGPAADPVTLGANRRRGWK